MGRDLSITFAKAKRFKAFPIAFAHDEEVRRIAQMETFPIAFAHDEEVRVETFLTIAFARSEEVRVKSFRLPSLRRKSSSFPDCLHS